MKSIDIIMNDGSKAIFHLLDRETIKLELSFNKLSTTGNSNGLNFLDFEDQMMLSVGENITDLIGEDFIIGRIYRKEDSFFLDSKQKEINQMP
jgi:hypothetical protein